MSGVGSGTTPCDEKVQLPIAVQHQDEPVKLDEFKAYVARGSGADLPGIWGLDSMQEKDAVICLRKGKELVAFPGPGGYEIKWSPGTKRLPMAPAPSGHMVIPCDNFDKVKDDRCNDQISFITDHTNSVTTSTEAAPTE